MRSVFSPQRAPESVSIFFTLLLAFSFPAQVGVAQTAPGAAASPASHETTPTPATTTPSTTDNLSTWFRLQREPVAGGAELLTVFGSLDGLRRDDPSGSDVPLVSLLRDTLGDDDKDNDRLRYVWLLTYTRPTATQRVASAIPFLYKRVGNNKHAASDRPPPAMIDLAAPERDFWRRVLWTTAQSIFFNPYGAPAKSSIRTFRRNAGEYRKAHIVRALAILSLYEHEAGVASVFTPAEMSEIQGRFMLTEKMLGGFVDDSYLQRVQRNQNAAWLDARGHNWELLRQRAEAEGLIFEPLTLPDGSATHALLWIAREDLATNRQRRFNSRFLNISNPWNDRRLANWDGWSEMRYFDAEHRPVASEAAGARPVEMIPLALYGLDNPKIPTLLIDFRNAGNAKRREMSRRIIEDVTRNVLSLSRFGDVHYFLGRTVFDFVTSRRGMDINQPTRLRAYSQLKLLLALDTSLDPDFRQELSRRLERVSMNPLENDLAAEAELARAQYAALLAYARRTDGLPARLDRERRAELVPLAHGRAGRMVFRIANVMSLGFYKHREKASLAEQRAQLDVERRLIFHRRFLREVSKSTPLVEVVWNVEDVRRSLSFIAEHGSRAGAKTATAAARIFARTNDAETRRLCLNSLYRINNETAKNELLRIYRSPEIDPSIRTLSASLLRRAMQEEQRITPSDARAIVTMIGQ